LRPGSAARQQTTKTTDSPPGTQRAVLNRQERGPACPKARPRPAALFGKSKQYFSCIKMLVGATGRVKIAYQRRITAAGSWCSISRQLRGAIQLLRL
jgi:hypothetical protein